MDLRSRFATISECRSSLDNYEIPNEWWSRRFEYPWASQFVMPDDVVVDAACGVPHFFKYWLAEHCKSVLAIDADKAIEQIIAPKNMTVVAGDISRLPMEDSSVDTLFCISVLEHVPTSTARKHILNEFARVLKPGSGKAIVTVDVSEITLFDYLRLVWDSDLAFAGEVEQECRPESNLLIGHMPQCTPHPLNAFCSVLRRVR